MSDEIEFPYDTSLGPCIRHEGPHYHIRLPDGQVTGIRANGEPSPENVEADIASPATEPVSVPQEVTRPRFMIALRKVLGIAEGQVYAMISAISDAEQQEDVRDWFDHGVFFRRDDATLIGFAAAQSVTPEQLDAVFIYAGTAT
jgi:hypothetical protein